MKKTIAVLFAVLFALSVFTACGNKNETHSETPRVKFTMADKKTFVVELYPQYAPETVANFLGLVEAGEYDGVTFHRISEGFVAQGGAYLPDGTMRSSKTIKGEFAANNFPQNIMKHERGVISMARQSNSYDSASNQFFICYKTITSLDGSYAAFGKVVEGMETIDSFLESERTMNSLGEIAEPVEPIVIKRAVVIS